MANENQKHCPTTRIGERCRCHEGEKHHHRAMERDCHSPLNPLVIVSSSTPRFTIIRKSMQLTFSNAIYDCTIACRSSLKAAPQVADAYPEWKCNQMYPGRDVDNLNAPICVMNQLMKVATVAGIPRHRYLRKAFLAMSVLASSGFPARMSCKGFIAQRYPDMTKNVHTARYPPSKRSRVNGI